MNKIYKVIWNESLGRSIVVSELVKGKSLVGYLFHRHMLYKNLLKKLNFQKYKAVI
ncbi:hypothetical protein B9T31_16650 [Acinetobacter sp. ANC 4558]|uniref:ESPR domain-containing protein n=1 Tax=Acinetobacter sp. ANC 4558 TaxID=1977876 RepID=UPI000A3586E5|nr:ESPR domain-containing protein [Acinetobacter sp. ANC 4558]OTG79870.1 hypothetical protein B9T31_16650 [Acinetobacter sp. ANC 4558]